MSQDEKYTFCEGLLGQFCSVAHTRNDSLLFGRMLGEQLSPFRMVFLDGSTQTSLNFSFGVYLDVLSLSAGEVEVE